MRNSSRLAALILFAAFSFSVSAAKKLECEINFQTSYGRILNMLAERNLITHEELDHIRQSRTPINPYGNRARNEGNLAIKQGFERSLRLPETRKNWKQIRQAAEHILETLQQTTTSVHEAKVSTNKVLNPKLIATVPFGTPAKAQFTYNPAAHSLVLWNTNSQGGDVTWYGVNSKRAKTTSHFNELTGVVRRNGELWVAEIDGKVAKVYKWPSVIPHVEIEGVQGSLLTLFEAPTGQLLLANYQGRKVTIYDVTKKGESVVLYSKGPEGHSAPVFHVTRTGEVFVAILHDRRTQILKYVSGSFEEFGATNCGHNPIRKVNMVSDSRGNLYLGEDEELPSSYYVTMFDPKGMPTRLWQTGRRIFSHKTPTLHIDGQDKLTLAIVFDSDRKELNLIDLSDPKQSRIKIKAPGEVEVPPVFFTLPNGTQAMIVAMESEKAVIYSVADGSVLARVDAQTSYEYPPTVHELPDDQLVLAIESMMKEIKVFDLWTPSSEREGEAP